MSHTLRTFRTLCVQILWNVLGAAATFVPATLSLLFARTAGIERNAGASPPTSAARYRSEIPFRPELFSQELSCVSWSV